MEHRQNGLEIEIEYKGTEVEQRRDILERIKDSKLSHEKEITLYETTQQQSDWNQLQFNHQYVASTRMAEACWHLDCSRTLEHERLTRDNNTGTAIMNTSTDNLTGRSSA